MSLVRFELTAEKSASDEKMRSSEFCVATPTAVCPVTSSRDAKGKNGPASSITSPASRPASVRSPV